MIKRPKKRASGTIRAAGNALLPAPPVGRLTFLSSTQLDLGAYRQTAIGEIARVGWQSVMPSEHGTIHAGPMLSRCVQELARCEMFVLVVGYRCGWIPEACHGGDGEKSITQIEYEAWKLRETYCRAWPAIVLFAEGGDEYLDVGQTQVEKARQVLFRSKVKSETTVHPFTYSPAGDPTQAHSLREFGLTLREQLVQAKDRLANQTRMAALREKAEARKHADEALAKLALMSSQLAAAQQELRALRERQPADAVLLTATSGIVGLGLGAMLANSGKQRRR